DHSESTRGGTVVVHNGGLAGQPGQKPHPVSTHGVDQDGEPFVRVVTQQRAPTASIGGELHGRPHGMAGQHISGQGRDGVLGHGEHTWDSSISAKNAKKGRRTYEKS